MRYSEVVYHDYVSLFPAVEDHVSPHYVSHVTLVPVRYFTPVTEARVKPNSHWTKEEEEQPTQQPTKPGEQEISWPLSALEDVVVFLIYHAPMKYLE